MFCAYLDMATTAGLVRLSHCASEAPSSGRPLTPCLPEMWLAHDALPPRNGASCLALARHCSKKLDPNAAKELSQPCLRLSRPSAAHVAAPHASTSFRRRTKNSSWRLYGPVCPAICSFGPFQVATPRLHSIKLRCLSVPDLNWGHSGCERGGSMRSGVRDDGVALLLHHPILRALLRRTLPELFPTRPGVGVPGRKPRARGLWRSTLRRPGDALSQAGWRFMAGATVA